MPAPRLGTPRILLDPARYQIAIAFVLIFIFSTLPSHGQLDSSARGSSLEELRTAIEDSQSLTDTDRVAALNAIESASVLSQRTIHLKAQTQSFMDLAQAAPALLDSVLAELDAGAQNIIVLPESDASATELEQALAQASADLRLAREILLEIDDEIAHRRDRRSSLPDEIAAAMQRQVNLQETLLVSGEGLLAAARTAESQARADEVDALIQLLQSELASYDARQELLPARRDRAARRVAELVDIEQQWQDIVQAARKSEAAQAAREAQKLRIEAAEQSDALLSFAAINETLARRRASREGVPQELAETERELLIAKQQFAELQSQYTVVVHRLNTSGLSRATGIVLRRQYESLPNLATLRKQRNETRERLEQAEMLLVERQELRFGAGDIDYTIEALRAATRESSPEVDVTSPEFAEVARRLAVARRDLLDQLVVDSTASFERLLELEEHYSTLLDATQEYREFIGERILWVRSINPQLSSTFVDGVDITNLTFAIDAVDSSVDLQSTTAQAARALKSSPLLTVAIGLAVISGLGIYLWTGRVHRKLAEQVKSYRTDRLRYTYAALGVSLLAAIPLPIGWWTTAYLFSQSTGDSALISSLAWAMQQTFPLLIWLCVAASLLTKNGPVDSHFRWPTTSVVSMRRHLRWAGPLFLLLSLAALAINHLRDTSLNASYGRGSFIASQVVFAALVWIVLHPKRTVLRGYLSGNSGTTTSRLILVACLLGTALPLFLAAFSWMGYHYTAIELSSRVTMTVGLISILVVANAILMRWLFIARRRVAVEDAKRRREQAIAEANAAPDEEGPTESSLPPIDEEKLNLPAISGQTMQLFRASVAVSLALGLLAIWSSVLPALRAFDQVEIWPEIRIADERVDPAIEALDVNSMLVTGSSLNNTTSPPGTTSTHDPARPLLDPSALGTNGARADGQPQREAGDNVISLADLGLALVFGFIAFAAFRNLPGLVEIFVLQRLPLDAASRFALSTVLRYAIGIAGVLATSAVLGISWDKVQWLAAALTFGLAFGLQEIFANFVSGLIILAERPVRIGDTVTVGGVTGVVTKIRMRATTVTDWDRKELVIPNRQFITGEVINWTLSDPTLRVIVPVGVAYGSDIQLVEQTLMQIGEENNLVLKDPKHYVLFRDFGDSTLDFELRVFISNIDNILNVPHQLRIAIDKKFRELDIEIAFPQRDLHLRSVDPMISLAEQIRSGKPDDQRASD